MVTEVKGVSDLNFKMMMAAKNRQQNKGSASILRTLDKEGLEEINEIAGPSL